MIGHAAAAPFATREARADPVPADGLLHPVALVALATLVLNDHVLKAIAPSPLTGILSDVAGMVLFPLVLQAAWELLSRGPRARSSLGAIGIACLATGIAFAAVELVPVAADAYRYGVGALQWPLTALVAALGSDPIPPLRPVVAVADPFDLLALPALVVPWSIGRGRMRDGRWRVAQR